MPDRASKLFSELGFVFISVPKTASNSIWDVVLPDPSYKPFQHVQAKVVKQCMDHFTPGMWDVMYRFSCVRHTFDSVRSWYMYHTTHPDISDKVKSFYDFSFEDWVLDYDCMTHWELEEQKRLNPLWDGSNPLHQHRWITDNEGNALIHDVIYQDKLEDGLQTVSNRIPLNRELQKLNTSGNVTDIILSDDVKATLLNIFSEDFAMFEFQEDRE